MGKLHRYTYPKHTREYFIPSAGHRTKNIYNFSGKGTCYTEYKVFVVTGNTIE